MPIKTGTLEKFPLASKMSGSSSRYRICPRSGSTTGLQGEPVHGGLFKFALIISSGDRCEVQVFRRFN